MADFFREVAIAKAKKQTVMVDTFLEEAPILGMMPMQQTSDGLINKYEELDSVVEAQVVDLESALPTVNSTSALKNVQLNVIGGTIFVSQDKARQMGGKDNYFAMKLPSVLRKTGMSHEKSLIYNTFRANSIANGNVESAGGSTAGGQNSIVIVKWVPGEVTGLYDAGSFGDGKIFQFDDLYGGALMKDSSGVPGYERQMKNYTGVQIADPKYVQSIVNIDLKAADTESGYTALPDEELISDLLVDARANPANTFIYMGARTKSALNYYKSSRLQTNVMDNNLNRVFDQWDGINIITSYNFDQNTEAVVTLS